MLIPDKLYNVLKWVCLVGLPACSVLVFTLGQIWAFDTTAIVGTIAAIQTFLGALLGISNYNYNKQAVTENQNETVVNPETDSK